MINIMHYFERQELKEKLIVLAKKYHYGDEMLESEREVIKAFLDLNTRGSGKKNIEDFFECLEELLFFLNVRGEVAENDED